MPHHFSKSSAAPVCHGPAGGACSATETSSWIKGEARGIEGGMEKEGKGGTKQEGNEMKGGERKRKENAILII